MKRGLDILKDAYAHSGNRLTLLMVLLVSTGISDGISMVLLYPLLDAAGLGTTTQASSSTLGIFFRQFFAWFGTAPTLLNVSLLLISSFIIQGFLFTAQNWLLVDIQKKYIASWQKQLFSDFIAVEWPYFVGQKAGEMVNSIIVECLRLGGAFFAIVQLMVAAVILFIYMIIALVASWKVMLYLLTSAAILFVLVLPILRATRRFGGEQGRVSANLTGTLSEMLGGAKVIKASAGEAKATALMAAQIDQMRSNLTWGAFLPTNIRSVFEFGGILMILGVLVFGLKVEQVSAAQILLVIALIARLFPRLMQIQLFFNLLNLSAPAYSILRNTHRRFASRREGTRPTTTGAIDLESILPADIRAQELVMRYGENTVLNRISFVVPAGQMVGFVGPSGAGKTTLIDAIIGLVAPSEGQIMVGNIPLQDIELGAWRAKIGYVSQETFLFHDTIANNIRWNVPHVSMDAVESAARTAGLESFVSNLPAGYDTVVGDRGAKLSGGQRQRISMARALVRQPALLVLDEATSALDSLSEQEIMGVLNSLRGKTSIIIVAHRLATVRNADFIYVVDHGRIVEQGSWAALSGHRELFHRLMQAQAIGDYN